MIELERADSTRISLERGISDARARRVVHAIARGRPLASGSPAGRATAIAVFKATTGVPPRDAEPRAPCAFELERADSTRVSLERGIFDARARRVVRAIARGRPLASGSPAGRE